MKRRVQYRRAILLTVLVLASVSLMNVTGASRDEVSLWQRLFWKVAGPVNAGMAAIREWSFRISLAFRDKEKLAEENRKLLSEIESIKALQARIAELEKENARLKELLGISEANPGKFRVAKVVGRNPSKWYSTVIISAGKNDGINDDAVVVSPGGLVGRVVQSQEAWATVLLVTDPESGVGAMVERSRDYGVVVGGSGPDALILRLFSKDADVAVGDKIITSGLGSKYPPGILIGEVVSVYVPKPGLVKEALVRPSSDLEHLEEVMVVVR